MIDKIGQILFWCTFIVPLLVLFTCLIYVKKKEVQFRIVFSFLLAAASLIFIVQSWTAILYRDGLSAGFESSSGILSITRTLAHLNIYWIIAGGVCATLGIILILVPFGSKQKSEA